MSLLQSLYTMLQICNRKYIRKMNQSAQATIVMVCASNQPTRSEQKEMH